MQTKLNRGALSALVAALWVTPVMAEPLSDDAALQLLQRVNDLEQELRNLRGDNEKLQNELQTLKSKQQENFQQVDEKLDKLQDSPGGNGTTSVGTTPSPDTAKTDTGTASASDASKTSTSTVSLDAAKADADKSAKGDANGFYSYGTGKQDDKNAGSSKPDTAGGDKPAEVTADKTATASTDKAATDKTADKTDKPDSSADKKLPEQEERSVYDQAFQTLLQDPKEAVPEFRSFLKDYPNSPLASSAQYWIGEALYAEKDFKGAIEEFLIVLKEHKSSDKAPDAALKLGFSFYELKDWEKARKTLEDVISFFPNNTDTTKLAQERLDKMKAEGH